MSKKVLPALWNAKKKKWYSFKKRKGIQQQDIEINEETRVIQVESYSKIRLHTACSFWAYFPCRGNEYDASYRCSRCLKYPINCGSSVFRLKVRGSHFGPSAPSTLREIDARQSLTVKRFSHGNWLTRTWGLSVLNVLMETKQIKLKSPTQRTAHKLHIRCSPLMTYK